MSNMESMLLGDDSSSGESDDEVDVPTGNTAAASAPAPSPSPVARPPVVRPTPASVPAPAPAPANSDLNARLKNLYSSQSKRPAASSQPSPSSSDPPPNRSHRPGVPQTSSVPPLSRMPPSQPRPIVRPTRPTAQPRTSMNTAQPRTSMNIAQPRTSMNIAQPRTSMNISQPRTNMNIAQPRTSMNIAQPRTSMNRPHSQQVHAQRAPMQVPQPTPYSRSHPSSRPGQPPSRSTYPQPSQPPQHRSQPQQDPFAPTPLSQIKQKEKMEAQRRMPASSNSNRRGSSSMPEYSSGSRGGSYSNSSGRSAQGQSGSSSRSAQGQSGSSGRSAREQEVRVKAQEVRRQKDNFLVFTKVLIKYLEQKDPTMHRQAKQIISDCAERNRRQEPGFLSVTVAMKKRLKELVGDNYWKRAEAYLKHFLERQGNRSSSSGHTIQQQQQAVRLKQQHAARFKQQQRQTHHGSAQSSNSAMTQQTKNESKNRPSSNTNQTAQSNRSSSAKKSAAPKRRGSGASTPTGGRKASAAAAQPMEQVEEPPREYNELMEMVDHAVHYDWATAGQLIKSKADLQVDLEQRKLLYGESKPKSPAAEMCGPRPGWDKANVFSARAAWARVHLGEQKAAQHAPVVADGLLTLPTNNTLTPIESATAWTNEEKAEDDVALAMLSEGCQQYLKGILQKAVHCARQRQNIDGIRLWHQQHMATENQKPSLSLRLGCDVSRQVAQANGNAAMTCKRMEEALERQSGIPSRARVLKGETLEEATSMADLSLRPQLAKGVENADLQGKRCFEEYGGRNSSEPPLGRVPKRAKVETIDLVNGSNITETFGRHHRAVTASVSAFY